MPKDISGINIFTDPITIPIDGDPVIQTGPSGIGSERVYQGLANRDVYLRSQIDALLARIAAIEGRGPELPVGAVIAWAGNSDPAYGHWSWCDGRPMSRSENAALFAAIGTTWGAGDGATTFNIPDIRGRTIVGVGPGAGLTPRTLGQLFGEETTAPTLLNHFHDTGQFNHSHALSDPGHGHGIGGSVIGAGPEGGYTSVGDTYSQTSMYNAAIISIQDGFVTLSVYPAGDSAREANMQPSATLWYMIRVS